MELPPAPCPSVCVSAVPGPSFLVYALPLSHLPPVQLTHNAVCPKEEGPVPARREPRNRFSPGQRGLLWWQAGSVLAGVCGLPQKVGEKRFAISAFLVQRQEKSGPGSMAGHGRDACVVSEG